MMDATDNESDEPIDETVEMLMQDLDALRVRYARLGTMAVATFVGALETYKFIVLTGNFGDDDDDDGELITDPPSGVASGRGG